MENWDLLPQNEKYKYLSGLLIEIENSKEFQGKLIEDDPVLQEQKDNDILELKNIISQELRNDGILKKHVNGRWFYMF